MFSTTGCAGSCAYAIDPLRHAKAAAATITDLVMPAPFMCDYDITVLSRAITLTAALALLGPSLVVSRATPPGFPRVVLWAWERPIDLRRLPAGTAVAFLAQTITIADGAYLVSPRRQPLRVDPSTPLVAVTRIDAPRGTGSPDVGAIARAIAATSRLPRVTGVQIDF